MAIRLTQTRYGAERARLELALRMIAHEARTCTIKSCTGLSDDHIRRLYSTYVKPALGDAVRRQRGKSPSRTGVYVKNATNQCEATTLAILFTAFDLIAIAGDGSIVSLLDPHSVAYGRQFCLAYETYKSVHRAPHFCFERAWNLLLALAAGEELVLVDCRECDGFYVQHVLEVDEQRCPCCRLKGISSRRSQTVVEDFATRRRVAAARAAGRLRMPHRNPSR